MRKWRLVIIPIVVFAAAVGWWATDSMLHRPIDPASIQEVTVWGEATPSRPATAQEQAQIVQWFNAGTDARANRLAAGTTPSAVINIRFENGAKVGILRSGTDFEVQDSRSGRPRYYWLKQSDLRAFLDKLAKG